MSEELKSLVRFIKKTKKNVLFYDFN
jgi:hypothetical protein